MTWSALALSLCLGAAPHGRAHPSHLSFAEVEYNARNGHLEVALQLVPEDLEQALRWHTRRRLELDRSPDVDAALFAYLSERFVLRGPEGAPRALAWIGKEVTLKEAWLYFEFELGPRLDGAVLEHQVLFELQEDQVNAVQLRWPAAGGGAPTKSALRFSTTQPAFELRADGPRPVEAAPTRAAPAARAEPRLRARFDAALTGIAGAVFLDTVADPEALPEGWQGALLDALQQGEGALHAEDLRVQLAIAQLIGGHVETSRGHLRACADRGGVVLTLARLRRELARSAEHAEQRRLSSLARRLREAERRARLEL